MEKRLTMFMMSLFLCVGSMLAQTKVSGTVLSQEDGQPIIGAAVKVVGTSTGMLTDVNGRFSIALPAGSNQLEVTYLGYEGKTVTAKNGMRIFLKADAKMVDEVVVVAYGTQKKSSFTGSASTMKSDKIEKLQVSNLSKALEGAVAGVQIASASGTPGSGASIIVRGIGSISSSQSPLIVVDGVPYEGSLNSISSQDIESMTVLKDAAANSMYGARGANGVIMITTKAAKAGKAKVNFEGRWGFNTRCVPNYDIISDPGEYYEMFFEAYRNQLASSMGYAAAADYAAKHLIDEQLKYNVFKNVPDDQLIDPLTGKLNPAAKELKWSDDWTKDPFSSSLRQEYNVNISGGSDATQAYFSAGYLGDEGYMVGSDFDRFSVRAKVDQKLGQYVKTGVNLSYARTNQKQFTTNPSGYSNYSNIFMFSQMIAPIYPIYLYNPDGSLWLDDNNERQYDWGTEYARPYASEQNPLAAAEANKNEVIRDNFSSRGYIEFNFLKDFKFTANVAYDVFNTMQTRFMTPIGGDAKNVGGRGYKNNSRYEALNVNQILDWNHAFGKHGVHLMAVHENKQDRNNYLYGQMTNYSDYTNPEFSNAALYQDLTSYQYEYALEGWLAKGEYNYNDTYYLNASIRRDGSSRFHPDNRWGTFWAVGGAWRLDKEAFMQNVKAISALKLKASYGTQGNDNIDSDYMNAYSDMYSVGRLAGGAAAFSKYFRGNPDLTWEKQAMFNVGFELGLLKRININFDFFIKNNKDMLFASPLAQSEGAPSWIYKNEVDMKNTGFEVEISADIIKTKDIKWNASLNFTHYKNELTRLPASKPEEKYPAGFERGSYWWKLGSSIYNWSGYEYVGVDHATGQPQYWAYTYEMQDDGVTPKVDGDGNKIVKEKKIVNTSSEATIVNLDKSAIPDIMGGFSTSLEAYGFDLSIQTAFQLGGWVRDSYYSSLMTAGDHGDNFHKDMFNRWTPAHTDTDIPALKASSQDAGIYATSDFFLTKANYFNLKNITLGYTIPVKLTNKIGVDRIRVYLTGDNVWLLSKRKGLDPRQSFSGATDFVYSALSSYSAGINISF